MTFIRLKKNDSAFIIRNGIELEVIIDEDATISLTVIDELKKVLEDLGGLKGCSK